MAQVHLCRFCGKTVNEESEDYVDLNEHDVYNSAKKLAHANCFEAAPVDAPPAAKA